MGLSVGIVGLPNVGKSTLFNALLKKQQAYVANFPFATIEPNIGIVPVPDARLNQLQSVIVGQSQITPPIVPATVEFVDIAGLIAGASKGEGLGNKFLSHIRETSAICHVVRAFSDPDIVKQGVSDPKTDLEVVETELKLADFQTLENQPSFAEASKGKKDPNDSVLQRAKIADKLREAIQKGIPARDVELTEEEWKIARQLSLLTAKPILVVLNVDEKDVASSKQYVERYAKELGVNEDQIVVICAKAEAELAALSEEDQKEYLKSIGAEHSALDNLIQKAFATLGLITFLTAGEKEVRAWTIPVGINAQDAAGVIHTDFIKNFIKADVVDFDDFINPNGLASPKPGEGGWKTCRELGKVRSEGRDYIVKDGDVIEFKIGN